MFELNVFVADFIGSKCSNVWRFSYVTRYDATDATSLMMYGR
jgi:hypothetical protein